MKTLIFDFNDTLSPSNFIQSFRKYEDKIGYKADEFVNTYIAAGLLAKLLEGGYNNEIDFWTDVSQLTGANIKVLLEIRQEIADSKIIDKNLLILIKELRGSNQLALVTDNVLETFDYWVEKFELNTFFDLIANSARYRLLKSDPRLYKAVLKELHSLPQDSILIDDHEANLEVAAQLGIATVLFRGVDDLRKTLDKLGITVK